MTDAPYYQDDTLTLLLGNARTVLSTLAAGSVDCVVTSPPYFGLRDYEGNPDQIGLEETPAEYVAALVAVFAEVRRVLAEDGTLWLNLGDSYVHSGSGTQGKAGARANRRFTADRVPGSNVLTAKNLLGIPWQVAFALQEAGWILRNAIVWSKPNAMPDSALDRLTNRYEMLFLLTKRGKYWFDLDPIRPPIREEYSGAGLSKLHGAAATGMVRHGKHKSTLRERPEKGRNPGDIWDISTTPLPEAHFAAFPAELPRRCIAAGCKPSGTVLDPFSGAGTTALAAQQLGRRAIGIDINAKYHDIALKRMANAPLPLLDGGAA